MFLFHWPRQYDDLAYPCGASANPSFVALMPASDRSALRRRPISTRNRARCDSSVNLAPNARASSTSLGTSPGHASPSARASANNTGRLASGTTTVLAVRTALRHASTGSSCSKRRKSLRSAATDWRGSGSSYRGFGSTRGIDLTPTRITNRWPTSSESARSSSSITSCSGRTGRRVVPRAQ